MTPPKTHSDFQQEVCFSCFTKPAKEGAKFRAISDSIKTQIIDSGFFPQYGSDKWSWLPTCICESCRKKLAQPEARGPLARRDYDLLDPPTNRRNLRSGHCNCGGRRATVRLVSVCPRGEIVEARSQSRRRRRRVNQFSCAAPALVRGAKALARHTCATSPKPKTTSLASSTALMRPPRKGLCQRN